ncbi:Mur ligase family protein [Alicyclobacillus dauci]|uniref:Lipid II isoglutaminyl synthase (glutamine-hydrolyzing) subunit MurT n=1 Tax=Alicyclobacillus dauci TaxID=1475485 RepID=A0ABY6YYT2_9BACL|nr:Mur ligase family protein [Alicyclobacillus dauci]WAH35747.1 MurT ligase domain-containing protein [Alicyclobacillus dauci]
MLGILIGKLVTWLLRLRGKDATSFPGKVALKVSPKLLHQFGKKIERVIVVTGTNGKTTTTSLLASMIQHDEPVITNHKGANLVQGIATAFLQHANWRGKLAAKTAVIEVDEATFPLIADAFPIVVTVVTNVFRDQLDRYGELDATVEKIFSAIRKTNSCLVLNADDPICRNLGLRASRKTFYYGMAHDTARHSERRQMRDGQFCMQCGQELFYDAFWYGQLGLYRCSHCDFTRPHPEFVGVYQGKTMTLSEDSLPDIQLSMPVQGLYNAYNVLAAASAARVVGLWAGPIHDGLADYIPPDGRMQSFATAAPVTLNLIKNPTGCDSVVQAVVTEPGGKIVVIGINDLAADGRDVSWLWDADFELLSEDDGISRFITSGFRAEDMALRLKYAGIDESKITIETDMNKAVDLAISYGVEEHLPVFVLSTYTLLHPTVHNLSAKARENESTNFEYRASVS